jgi:hypothetical protein
MNLILEAVAIKIEGKITLCGITQPTSINSIRAVSHIRGPQATSGLEKNFRYMH